MYRLRGSDAFAVYSESPTSPFVTLKVAIYGPTNRDDAPGPGDLKQFVKERIAVTGAGRADYRILRVPFDLHHPVWVHDPDFSPDNHIHEAKLSPPGGTEELCQFLSDLMGKPLNPEIPLWEIWLISGLADGKMAVAFKIHHALADGKTISRLIEIAHRRTDFGDMSEEERGGEPLPAKSLLVGSALLDLARSYTVEFPHFYHHIKQARQKNAAIIEAMAGVEENVVPPFSAPFTLLNKMGGGAERIYRYETFSLSEFKSLARHFDCTINTFVMGVCSETLKRYLHDVDDLPAEPLLAAMPIGDQAGGRLKKLLKCDIQNNNLAVAVLPLYQNIEDFNQRLCAIKAASRAATDHVRHADGRRVDNYFDYLPGTAVRMMHSAINRRQRKKKNPYANTVISNVPGPRQTLYALDGRLQLEELLSVGNLTDAGHLNITVWSYVDKLSFSLLVRKGALPRPERIAAHLNVVFEEIRSRYLVDIAEES